MRNYGYPICGIRKIQKSPTFFFLFFPIPILIQSFNLKVRVNCKIVEFYEKLIEEIKKKKLIKSTSARQFFFHSYLQCCHLEKKLLLSLATL